MKRFYFVLLFCLCALYANAQYKLEVKTQPYMEITNPTYVIPDTSIYFANVTEAPDFYIKAFDKQYDLNNGVYIPLRQGYAYILNDNYSTTIYAAKGEYGARAGQGQTSVFSFGTEGSAGTQIHTLQWKNMGFKNGDSTDFVDFQLRLFEADNVIEFHFGPSSVGANLYESGANGPTVGLLEMDESFSTIYNTHWLQGNPASPVMISSSGVITLNSTPANGTLYRFVPDNSTSINTVINSKGRYQIYPTILQQNGRLNIKTSEQDYTLMVHDLTGKEMLVNSNLSGNEEVSLSNIPHGIYLVSVNGEFLGKVVK